MVLSGGGAKAAAQVGAVRALLEYGAQPQQYIGTSMGSVVAACFASGLDYDEVLRRVTSLRRRDVARMSPSILLGPFARSLLRGGPLRRTIRSLVPVGRFEELRTPLTVTAVDQASGALVLFGDGGRNDVPLPDALYASCALPSYYPPLESGGRTYIDGGMRSVLALDVARQRGADLIYAVRTGASFEAKPAQGASRLPHLITAFGKALGIMMAAQTDAEIARCRDSAIPLILVEPGVEQETTFALERVRQFVDDGYAAGTRALAAWAATSVRPSSTSPS